MLCPSSINTETILLTIEMHSTHHVHNHAYFPMKPSSASFGPDLRRRFPHAAASGSRIGTKSHAGSPQQVYPPQAVGGTSTHCQPKPSRAPLFMQARRVCTTFYCLLFCFVDTTAIIIISHRQHLLHRRLILLLLRTARPRQRQPTRLLSPPPARLHSPTLSG